VPRLTPAINGLANLDSAARARQTSKSGDRCGLPLITTF
jgi:hypothetical protein